MQMPIRSLQSMLRLLQRHAGKPTTVVPDGIFGPETARAVREFQQQNGLPVTGVVRSGLVWGTQFHPEKSGDTGLRLLKAFGEL